MIRVRNLKKKYGKKCVVNDVTFDVTDGDIVAIMGPSEREKRIILRCLNLMETPTDGEITLNGEDILSGKIKKSDLRKRVGMVFRESALLNDRMLVENIATAPIQLLKTKKNKAYEDAMEMLKKMGINEKAKFFPDEVDEGVRRRAAIARAMVMKPEVLLLENPTHNLDSSMRYEVREVLSKIADSGQTIVMTTSDVELAKRIATKVVFIHKGRVVEQGVAKDVLDNPISDFTHTYLQRMYQMRFRIISHEFDFLRLSGELGKFCKDNCIDDEKRQRMQFVAYQMLTECVVRYIKKRRMDISFSVRFFDRKGRIEMTAGYAGPENNPLSNKAAAESVKKINEMTSQFKYYYGNYTNNITVII